MTASARVFDDLVSPSTHNNFENSFLLTCQLSLHGNSNTLVVEAADGGVGLRP